MSDRGRRRRRREAWVEERWKGYDGGKEGGKRRFVLRGSDPP